jgi:hypothetical protein
VRKQAGFTQRGEGDSTGAFTHQAMLLAPLLTPMNLPHWESTIFVEFLPVAPRLWVIFEDTAC